MLSQKSGRQSYLVRLGGLMRNEKFEKGEPLKAVAGGVRRS